MKSFAYNVVEENALGLRDLIEDSTEPLLIIRLNKNFKDATCLHFTFERISVSLNNQELALNPRELEILALNKATEHFEIELNRANFLIFVTNSFRAVNSC